MDATAGIGLSPDFPAAIRDEVLSEGGSLISAGNKDSGFLAEPLFGGEGILVADCGFRSPLAARGDLDATGRYSPRGRADPSPVQSS